MDKDSRIQFRVSASELEAIKRNADDNAMGVSDFARWACVHYGHGEEPDAAGMLEELKNIHKDADSIYQYIQESYFERPHEFGDIVQLNFIEHQLYRLNGKLKYISSAMAQLCGDRFPSLDDSFVFSEYQKNAKFLPKDQEGA